MDNVGDDCFGVVSTWGAKKYWNTKEVTLLSSKEVGGPIKTNACLSNKQYFRGQYKLQSYLEMIKSESIVMSGGSIFHSKRSFFDPGRLSYLVSKLRIKYVGAIGVSIGPYRSINDQKSVHTYLRRLRFLTLRDKTSYDEACSINLPYKPILAADLAMLLPIMIPKFKSFESDSKVLGISLCHYERYINKEIRNEKRRESVIIDSLLSLIRDGFNGVFRFFIFNSNATYGDQDITHEFLIKLKDKGSRVELVLYSINPVDIWIKVAECTAMVSIRLHGAIYAAAANIPCCLIEYHRKCNDFISDIGVDQKCIVGDACCSSNELADKLSNLLSRSQENFYPKRKKLIEMAELNFDLF